MYSGPHIFDRYCNFTCINQERACRVVAPDGKIAKSVQSMLSAATEDSALISTSLYMDNSFRDFVSRQYASPQDYFSSYREYIHNSLLQGVSINSSCHTGVCRQWNPDKRQWICTVIHRFAGTLVSAVYRDGYSPRLLFLMMKQMGARCCFLRGMNGLYSNKAECLVYWNQLQHTGPRFPEHGV